VRHRRGRGLVIAGQRVPPDRYSRCQHKSVIIERGSAAERHAACSRVERRRFILSNRNAFGADRFITETLRRDIAQAGDHRVAERASREGWVGLDERHLEFGIGATQRSRATGAAKPAPYYDDARLSLG